MQFVMHTELLGLKSTKIWEETNVCGGSLNDVFKSFNVTILSLFEVLNQSFAEAINFVCNVFISGSSKCTLG